MADYRAMYLRLSNAVADAIDILQNAHVEVEDIYLEDESKLSLLRPEDEEGEEDDE